MAEADGPVLIPATFQEGPSGWAMQTKRVTDIDQDTADGVA